MPETSGIHANRQHEASHDRHLSDAICLRAGIRKLCGIMPPGSLHGRANGLSLVEVQCIATTMRRGGESKSNLQGLNKDVRQILTNIQGDA